MNNDIVPGFDDEKTEGLRIRLQRIEDVPACLLLYLTGYIDTYSSNYFQKCVAKAIDAGNVRLIFDIANTGTISSVEIGCYTAFLKAIKPKGGDLVLLRMKPKTYEVYQLLGFSNFFNIKENLDEAISFFTASRKQDKRDIFPNILKETERIIKPSLGISPETFSGIPEPVTLNDDDDYTTLKGIAEMEPTPGDSLRHSSHEMMLRMIEIARSCDPSDGHSRRVSEYSVELYEQWAKTRNIPLLEVRKVIDVLRTAAFLHDVGMVAVSHATIKKPSTLTNDEILSMRQHTIVGCRLVNRSDFFWNYMSAEVALNHHENWDGSGYPGHIDNIYASKIYMGPGKRGTEIPLSARLVAIADVYDALVSPRAYRRAWKQDHAMSYIRYQAGKKFDSELMSVFLKMGTKLKDIQEKYLYQSKSKTN